MDSLSRLAAMATQSASLHELLHGVAELTRSLMRVPICVVWMLDKDKNGFIPKAFAGPTEQEATVAKLFISNKDSELKNFLEREEPVYCKDVTTSYMRPYRGVVQALGWKSVLSIRLCVEGRPIGFLEVYSRRRERDFTHFHQGLFQVFTGQAAIAGRRYQLGEGWHNNGNALLFWNHHPHVPQEEYSRCYASPTAYATMIRLCNVS